MKARSLRSRAGFVRVALLSALLLSIAPAAVFADVGPTSFVDEFDSPTLDPVWQVVEFTGTRVYGYTSPANHISLADNPGYLRYYLDPMTHPWGFLNGYQTSSPCYDYDPGLELHRLFSGEHWLFETRADYYMPYTNGRAEDVIVYFGDGGDKGLNIFAPGFPASSKIACDTGAEQDAIEQTVTAGGSSLTYDPASSLYNYVWKTDKAWAGSCRQLVVTLVDGTTHLANFKFK